MTWLGLAGAFLLLAVLTTLVERRRFRHFWSRSCTGPSWKVAFPAASKHEIREFLGLFVTAFAFRPDRKLCFEPGDRILDIYRTRYPSKLSADDMELETLVKMLEKRYGVNLIPLWHEEMTLGEAFQTTRRRVA